MNGGFSLRFQIKIIYRDLNFRMLLKSGPFKGLGYTQEIKLSKGSHINIVHFNCILTGINSQIPKTF